MIGKSTLRALVIETLLKTPHTQFNSIQNDVERLVIQHNLFPTKEECEARGVDNKYYAANTLTIDDNAAIFEITWDLIMERVLIPGDEQSTYRFPFVSLTSYGEDYAKGARIVRVAIDHPLLKLECQQLCQWDQLIKLCSLRGHEEGKPRWASPPPELRSVCA